MWLPVAQEAGRYIGIVMAENSNEKPTQVPELANDQRDYQISLHMDTVWIFDGNREVGRFTNTTWNSQYDSIFLKDNE